MQINATWTPAGASQATTFILAQSPDPIPLTNLKVNGARNIQEAQFFRATEVAYFDRGNRKTEVTFDVTRAFASQQLAEAFLLMHETQLPPSNFLATFIAGAAGSGQTSTRYLLNAALQTVASSIKGCTTFHSYRITGGVMSTSAN